MPAYHFLWLILAVLSSSAGLLGVVWCRCGRGPVQTCWGRRLFLLMLVASGVGSLATAFQAQVSLPYLGLAFAGLVIAMVWEAPKSQQARTWLPTEL